MVDTCILKDINVFIYFYSIFHCIGNLVEYFDVFLMYFNVFDCIYGIF
jgi:hypothetical protein